MKNISQTGKCRNVKTKKEKNLKTNSCYRVVGKAGK